MAHNKNFMLVIIIISFLALFSCWNLLISHNNHLKHHKTRRKAIEDDFTGQYDSDAVEETNKRDLPLKIRTNMSKSSNVTAAFDPIIGIMERVIAGRQRKGLDSGGLFNGFSDYLNYYEDLFNVTSRLEILFPNIDVNRDGFVSEKELTRWILTQNRMWKMAVNKLELKLIRKASSLAVDISSPSIAACLAREQFRSREKERGDGVLKKFGKSLQKLDNFFKKQPHEELAQKLEKERSHASLQVSEMSHAQAKQVMQQADDNKDGKLSLKEMIDNSYVFYNHYKDVDELRKQYYCKRRLKLKGHRLRPLNHLMQTLYQRRLHIDNFINMTSETGQEIN